MPTQFTCSQCGRSVRLGEPDPTLSAQRQLWFILHRDGDLSAGALLVCGGNATGEMFEGKEVHACFVQAMAKRDPEKPANLAEVLIPHCIKETEASLDRFRTLLVPWIRVVAAEDVL